jgi:hypothetical protein
MRRWWGMRGCWRNTPRRRGSTGLTEVRGRSGREAFPELLGFGEGGIDEQRGAALVAGFVNTASVQQGDGEICADVGAIGVGNYRGEVMRDGEVGAFLPG